MTHCNMKLLAKDIAAYIEEFAPLQYQEKWDNSGFCIGDKEQEIKGILVALDCTPELIKEAIEVGANMIITHHPLIFGGVSKINTGTEVGKMIIEAIKNEIVIYSCHTNMDKVIDGVSGRMAERLNLQDISVLSFEAEGVGLGVVGYLPKPISSEDFVSLLKKVFSIDQLRTSRLPDKKIHKVALCGGSGRSFLPLVNSLGADAYVSGDITYHDFFCSNDFLIADIGHFESEIDIVDTIYDILRKKLPTFAVRITNNKYNPVHYY